ncbi:MAG: hypothetical protein IMW89_05125 [Ktedonobacteraceae bacterium]|nr:hypothetical protein [Ktedonobacteraceae bacterium]
MILLLPYALMLVFLIQAVYTAQDLLFRVRPINMPGTLASLIWLIVALGVFVYELYHLLSWRRMQGRLRRQAQQVQRAQAPLLQQQVQRHP